MDNRDFNVVIVGSQRLWQRLKENIPEDAGFRRTFLPDGETIPDADILLFTPARNQIAQTVTQYRKDAASVPAAVVSEPLPAHAVVTLVRAGFTEVFDISTDMEMLREWLLNHYEEFLNRHATPIKTRSAGITKLHGGSAGIKAVRKLVEQAAEYADLTVLIQGETGTGKEMVARMIHERSHRGNKPFIEVNCSAIPETLMESEMLGNEKGAFTDARRSRTGFFELAAGGTLFLDEIGVMSPAMQNKILKIVEEKKFRRIGGETEITVDVRIIAGTNADLHAAVEAGDFRPDLLYRLKVFTIEIPPLRDRKDDLPVLTDHFMRAVKSQYSLKISGLHPGTEDLLRTYHWPGNVRELKHTVERACVLAGRGRILPSHLPEEIQSREIDPLNTDGLDSSEHQIVIPLPEPGISLNEIEKHIVRNVLKRCSGNQSEAARYLGISRTRLARKLNDNKE